MPTTSLDRPAFTPAAHLLITYKKAKKIPPISTLPRRRHTEEASACRFDVKKVVRRNCATNIAKLQNVLADEDMDF